MHDILIIILLFILFILQNLKNLLGQNVSQSRIEKLIKEVDITGDGKISFEEFLIMFRNDNVLAIKNEFTESNSNLTDSDSP